MKPFRGKRIGPQSRPAEFNSPNVGGRGSGIFGTAPCPAGVDVRTFRGESAATGSEAVRSSRGRWLAPRRRVLSPVKSAGLWAEELPPWSGTPAHSARLTWEDCSQCSLTTCGLGPGSLRPNSGSAANRSAPYPTRLETRTKESNMCASHGVLRNLKAQ